MNIFYVDKDPVIAAKNLCNSHVVKMILESAQLLSTAHNILDEPKENLYRSTHINHPSNKWVRESREHYIWLYKHFEGLCNEYTYRYGKTHATSRLLEFLYFTPYNILSKGFIDPPCAMPKEYIVENNAVESYRNYYRIGKAHLHKYTKREIPEWLNV